MRRAKINLSDLRYTKTQTLRYFNNAPAAFKQPSSLTNLQHRLTLAQGYRAIQRSSYVTQIYQSAEREGASVPMSQEEYLGIVTRSPRAYNCYLVNA